MPMSEYERTRRDTVKQAAQEFVAKEGVRRYAGHAESLLIANLEPILTKLYHDAFSRGYNERTVATQEIDRTACNTLALDADREQGIV
jgi:hypothetical protein